MIQVSEELIAPHIQQGLQLIERSIDGPNNITNRRIQTVHFTLHIAKRQIEAVYALVGLEHEYLGHALDRDRKGYDYMVGIGHLAAMVLANGAEGLVARLTEQQLFVGVVGAARHQISPLVLYQIEELIDHEAGWQRGYATITRHNYCLATNGTLETAKRVL
jgi:hypothetical protein